MNLGVHQIIQAPILTEESQIQARNANQYSFRVHPSANKRQIRDAIESVFPDVKVVSVNTMNYAGKRGAQTGRRRPGTTAKWKKAVVTLRDGDLINLI
ncbi:MAG: 50S ribosomal protein L23 [Candidatus Hydrogenedens sp.]|nr:50S ribosomal protein L23 [Candidatus Hydrogenedens sp.]